MDADKKRAALEQLMLKVLEIVPDAVLITAGDINANVKPDVTVVVGVSPPIVGPVVKAATADLPVDKIATATGGLLGVIGPGIKDAVGKLGVRL